MVWLEDERPSVAGRMGWVAAHLLCGRPIQNGPGLPSGMTRAERLLPPRPDRPGNASAPPARVRSQPRRGRTVRSRCEII